MPVMPRIDVRRAQRHSATSLRRHPGQRPCYNRHFARSSPRTASAAKCASAAQRPRAVCSACSKRTAACHRSSTTVAFGSATRCSRRSPGVAVAQHRRRRVRCHGGHCERLFERTGRNRRAVARESEAGLAALCVDYYASDHPKMALVLPMPAADVAAVKPNNDRSGRPQRRRLRRCGDIRQHDGLIDPHGSVPHRARVLCPADRRQFRQQVRDFATWRQRRISCRHIDQFGRYGCGFEVKGGGATC